LAAKPRITLCPSKLQEKEVILVNFDFNKYIEQKIKNFPNIRWSQTRKSWYILFEQFDLSAFFESVKELAFVDYSALLRRNKTGAPISCKQTKQSYNQKITLPAGYLEKLKQKRYSESTIKSYCHYFRDFQKAFMGKEIDKISIPEVNAYILALIKGGNISHSQQNLRINAIKFYYEKVLGKKKAYYGVERPRIEKKLPDVLSKEEVVAMIIATQNLKHKSIIALTYSCGLRRSELINLKLEDIDSKRMVIKLRGTKGRKDRYVQLAKASLNLLRKYYLKEKPVNWVFEGADGGQYSATSIFNVIKNSASKAGIKKRVYPHILRHSFATHHLEQGTDLRYIQAWLGHASSKTTEVYTRVSKKDLARFKNPLDEIYEGDD